MRLSVNCCGLTYVTDTADSAGVAAAAKSGVMLPSHSASAAKMVMVPRLDPAMRFMFHLACDLLHGKFDTTGENRSQSRIFPRQAKPATFRRQWRAVPFTNGDGTNADLRTESTRCTHGKPEAAGRRRPGGPPRNPGPHLDECDLCGAIASPGGDGLPGIGKHAGFFPHHPLRCGRHA